MKENKRIAQAARTASCTDDMKEMPRVGEEEDCRLVLQKSVKAQKATTESVYPIIEAES